MSQNAWRHYVATHVRTCTSPASVRRSIFVRPRSTFCRISVSSPHISFFEESEKVLTGLDHPRHWSRTTVNAATQKGSCWVSTPLVDNNNRAWIPAQLYISYIKYHATLNKEHNACFARSVLVSPSPSPVKALLNAFAGHGLVSHTCSFGAPYDYYV